MLEILAVEYEGVGLGLPEGFRCKRRCVRSFSAGISTVTRRAACSQRAGRMAIRKSVRKAFKADKTVNLSEWA